MRLTMAFHKNVGVSSLLAVETVRTSLFLPRRISIRMRRNTLLTLQQALRGIDAKHWYNFSKDRMELLQRLKPGQNWRDLPTHLHRKALGAALDSWGGRSGFCRRLAWDEPAPTLTTAPDGRATTLCHPAKSRPLSIEEYATLQ